MADQTPCSGWVWHELMTTDQKAAVSFYTRVLGWTTTSWAPGGVPGDPYTMFGKGEQTFAGMWPLPDEARQMGAPPHWLGYVFTPNVDETVTKATALGATVYVPPTDIPTVGRFATLADPFGAVFAAFTPSMQGGGSGELPGDHVFTWHELATKDFRAAFGFYQALFGWEKIEEHDMGPALGIYFIYGAGGKAMGGMFNVGTMPIPPNWLVYVSVPDINQAVAAAKDAGGTVMMGPHQVPDGDWIAQCKDPQGAAFAFHQKAKK
jgi:uncharacterized protein